MARAEHISQRRASTKEDNKACSDEPVNESPVDKIDDPMAVDVPAALQEEADFLEEEEALPSSSDREADKEEKEGEEGRGEVDLILAIELEDVGKLTRSNRVCLAGHEFFGRRFLHCQPGARLLLTSWAHFWLCRTAFQML